MVLPLRIGKSRLRQVRKGAPVWLVAVTAVLVGANISWAGAAAAQPVSDPVNAAGVSIDAGGPGDGGSFIADSYYSGGAGASNSTGSNGDISFPRTVSHPIPQADWNTDRFLASTYQIPDLSPGGVYQVRLYFLDWYWTKVGQRVFDVDINGVPVLQNFDIVQAAVNAGGDGQYIGVEEDFTETADSAGTITIDFIRGSVDQPMVNAIALAPEYVNAAGVSIDAGGPGDGGSFIADSYYSGGAGASNSTGSNGDISFPRTVSHPIPQADWNTDRFLASTYQIPDLSPGGVYQVRLYFLDWYWTKVGQRVFDVDINGVPVLQNFDIVQAAVNAGGDGQYIGVEEDFTETADSAGTITIDFIRGSVDQPMVNAIALAPQS